MDHIQGSFNIRDVLTHSSERSRSKAKVLVGRAMLPPKSLEKDLLQAPLSASLTWQHNSSFHVVASFVHTSACPNFSFFIRIPIMLD